MWGAGIWEGQQGFQKFGFTDWVVDPLTFALFLFLIFYTCNKYYLIRPYVLKSEGNILQ